mmetsp:Transcript_83514/g.244828  ORF Transcript_83514/g.244828 Transcript_83514/m.244828 type:complete len:201 (-) Transcript_83514:840-1442(-)
MLGLATKGATALGSNKCLIAHSEEPTSSVSCPLSLLGAKIRLRWTQRQSCVWLGMSVGSGSCALVYCHSCQQTMSWFRWTAWSISSQSRFSWPLMASFSCDSLATTVGSYSVVFVSRRVISRTVVSRTRPFLGLPEAPPLRDSVDSCSRASHVSRLRLASWSSERKPLPTSVATSSECRPPACLDGSSSASVKEGRSSLP